jgi:hypothetical protein
MRGLGQSKVRRNIGVGVALVGMALKQIDELLLSMS